jgi:hypothetical protein
MREMVVLGDVGTVVGMRKRSFVSVSGAVAPGDRTLLEGGGVMPYAF